MSRGGGSSAPVAIVLTLVAWVSIQDAAASKSAPAEVIKRAGSFRSPSGKCVAKLKHHEGDRLTLEVSSCKTRLSDDVTGIAWVARDQLVFSSSPVYGSPGLFLYRCGEDSALTIVGARQKDGAYPDGADYFELVRVSGGNDPVLTFRYFPHVDSIGPKGVSEGGVTATVHADGRGLTGIR